MTNIRLRPAHASDASPLAALMHASSAYHGPCASILDGSRGTLHRGGRYAAFWDISTAPAAPE
ncbi:hypothetical protein WEI85_40965 [Actinomycetes bacterium KLBMP 9797]